MGENREGMGEFFEEFSRWLRERPKLRGRLSRGHPSHDKLIKVELYDPKSGIVVLRRFLTPREFDKFKEEHKAGRWPDLDWRLAQ